ncbi:hypothetical protein OH768_20055 [Streptomyces sp. NBC_01622]|uniref:hypothetical protein n=1 Tax=Streptomyces sp. NBC_01622 TaxID=2975903 RepID=UPI003864530B|nr:hypothetical protein OH768_20055 [Streptomyces sp. NBC_01622]
MTEQRNGDGFPARLGAALRDVGVDDEAERRAVAAFRLARDSGDRATSPRREDDWRPGSA